MEDNLLYEARQRFGTKALYPYQRLVAGTILEACRGDSEHARNLVAVLPTGGGKSLCFQLPAAILEPPTLMVYPLLSLIADQQRRMKESGLAVAVFRGGQTREERRTIIDQCRNRRLDAVLASPEVLDTPFGREAISACEFGLAVVDEAHCVTEWGQTFRSSYLTLGTLLKPVPVVVAFTATASAATLEGLNETLFLGENVHRIIAHPDRAELRYTVVPVSSILRSLESGFRQARYCAEPDPFMVFASGDPFLLPAIVFCRTRGETERIARYIHAHTGVKNVRYYHAGLPSVERTAIEEWFFHANEAVLCATCAYGMGVDKSNVRTVIHTQPPATIEAYVQEAGRGGRDKKASCAVLMLPHAVDGVPTRIEDPRLEALASGDRCRRTCILEAFGAMPEGCAGCDYCAGRVVSRPERLETISRLRMTYTPSLAAKIARGDRLRYPNLVPMPGFGSLSDWSEMQIKDACR